MQPYSRVTLLAVTSSITLKRPRVETLKLHFYQVTNYTVPWRSCYFLDHSNLVCVHDYTSTPHIYMCLPDKIGIRQRVLGSAV